MKRLPIPTIGTTGPRRPLPPLQPINYHRARVRDLRALPIRDNPRLRLLDYRLTKAPGMTGAGKPRTHGHGSARLAGYVLSLCLTRDGGDGWFLETDARCFDEAAAQREGIAWNDRLLADLYRAVEREQMAAEGRSGLRAGGCGRFEGRN